MIDVDEATPSAPPSRLTEREAAIYARSREETLRDLVEELARFRPPPAALGMFHDGYNQAEQILTTLQARLAQLGPAPALPPGPCGLEGRIEGFDLLCGSAYQHEGLCAWARAERGAPTAPPPDPPRRPLVRTRVRRSLVAGIAAALEDLSRE